MASRATWTVIFVIGVMGGMKRKPPAVGGGLGEWLAVVFRGLLAAQSLEFGFHLGHAGFGGLARLSF